MKYRILQHGCDEYYVVQFRYRFLPIWLYHWENTTMRFYTLEEAQRALLHLKQLMTRPKFKVVG